MVNIMSFIDRLTIEEWELSLGAQFRAARIQAGLDQGELAELANISEGAVKSLETGKGSSLKTVIKVLRALDRTDWLRAFAPESSVSPIQVLKGKTTPRQRVSRSRQKV